MLINKSVLEKALELNLTLLTGCSRTTSHIERALRGARQEMGYDVV